MLALVTLLCALLVAVIAAPADVAILDKRAKVIADGNRPRDGNLPDWGFKYHATGYVAKGCPTGTKITTCYDSRLSNDPTKNIENIGGRKIQSNLFYSSLKPGDGKIREYTFRMKVDPSFTSVSGDPYTLVGVETKTPTNTQERIMSAYIAINDKDEVGVYTYENPGVPVFAIPKSRYVGKRTLHTWKLDSTPSNGKVTIKITNDEDKSEILSYTVPCPLISGDYRMRVGTTREAVAGMSPLRIYWGSWSGKYVTS
ncbi:hypothetical protein RhiLY_12522 [Ceratobasidium sp. AG-Ba]|nr:hypothetical protein RhiLY_12522 [Ceratobasidium sp. AG-Ba]